MIEGAWPQGTVIFAQRPPMHLGRCSGEKLRTQSSHVIALGPVRDVKQQIAEWYVRYGPALHRRCLSLIHNKDDAAELVQETFTQFYAQVDRFEGRSSPFTYLYRIATNLSIDRVRRRRTQGHTIDTADVEETELVAPANLTPDKKAANIQALAVLTQGLDEETLLVAVMSHVDGMTQEEIAEATDLSRRTIVKRLQDFTEFTQKRAKRKGVVHD